MTFRVLRGGSAAAFGYLRSAYLKRTYVSVPFTPRAGSFSLTIESTLAVTGPFTLPSLNLNAVACNGRITVVYPLTPPRTDTAPRKNFGQARTIVIVPRSAVSYLLANRRFRGTEILGGIRCASSNRRSCIWVNGARWTITFFVIIYLGNDTVVVKDMDFQIFAAVWKLVS